MHSYDIELLEQIASLNHKYNDMSETLIEIVEHIECQLQDNMIRYLKGKDGRVIAYADFLWIKTSEDVRLFEEISMVPDGKPGSILYINHCVIDSEDKSLIWELWKLRPKSDFVCWKRSDGKLKIWRQNYAKKNFQETT